MNTLLTKQASAGEGTGEQVAVYSGRCGEPGCKWQSLWHRDPERAMLALVRHVENRHDG